MANKKNPAEITPVYNRKCARNQLKKQIGSNKIKRAWRRLILKNT